MTYYANKAFLKKTICLLEIRLKHHSCYAKMIEILLLIDRSVISGLIVDVSLNRLVI